jgi:sensor histidine kinase YesM
MSSLPVSTPHATDYIAVPEVHPRAPLHLGRFFARCLQELTWPRVLVVVVFCAMYGGVLSTNPATGGLPESIQSYLLGVARALACFLPTFLVISVVANFAPKQPFARALVLAMVVALAVALGFVAMTGVEQVMVHWKFAESGHFSVLPLVMTGWLGLAIYLVHERDQAAARALDEEAEYRLDLGRQMSEAQLQVLQSQIEPHFLFNCLAHVRRLYRIDPRAGRAMMRHLSRYLGTAFAALREPGIELSRDLDLAVTYLNIQHIRMGARLEFVVDVPAEAMAAQVPPMTITTLVENSIKHGLSPLLEGGTVTIVARAERETLTIQISDTGRGFQASLGGGVGLANIRARLSMLHGAAASLTLLENAPRGVTATIVVPTQALSK